MDGGDGRGRWTGELEKENIRSQDDEEGKGRIITLYSRALIEIERDAVKNALLNWSLLAVFINNPNVTYSVSEETDCSHCVYLIDQFLWPSLAYSGPRLDPASQQILQLGQ